MNPQTAIFAASGAVVAALISALVTLYLSRQRTRIDIQSSLNEGFKGLIEELQEERKELRQKVSSQDDKLENLEKRIGNLLIVTTRFHKFILDQGLTPPLIDEGEFVIVPR